MVTFVISASVVRSRAASASLVVRLKLLYVLIILSLRSVVVTLVLLGANTWGSTILDSWKLNIILGLKWAFTNFH